MARDNGLCVCMVKPRVSDKRLAEEKVLHSLYYRIPNVSRSISRDFLPILSLRIYSRRCSGENYDHHNGRDCSDKNTNANNGVYPTRNDQENTEKITTKNQTNPTPVFEEVLPRLDSQDVAEETPSFRGKTLTGDCKGNTVKRGREKER